MAIKNKLATQDFAKEVVYAPAALTPEQQAQAQKNIGLPEITSEDAGLVLSVSEEGKWELNLVSGGGGEGSGVQSDWNVSNKSSLAYIKNKPFDDIPNSWINLIPSVKLDDFILNSTYNIIMRQRTAMFDGFTVGETYRITWDGITYECVAQNSSAVIANSIACGNCAPFGLSGNNEPFIVVYLNDGGFWELYVALTDTAGGNSHTVSIDGIGTATKKLDAKYTYTPDWNIAEEKLGGYIANKPFGTIPARTTIVEEKTIHLQGGKTAAFSLIDLEPANYILIINGKEYPTALEPIEGGASALCDFAMGVTTDEGLELSFMKNFQGQEGLDLIGVWNQDSSLDGDYTIKILSGQEVVKKIDSKYLPESASGSVDWEDVNNKPFYEEPNAWMELLPSTEFGPFYTHTSSGIQMFERGPTFKLVIGETYRVTWDGVTYECIAQDVHAILPEGIALGNGSAFGFNGNNEPFIIYLKNNFERYMSLTDVAPGNNHTVTVEGLGTKIHKIDQKYLYTPDWNVTDKTNPAYIKNKPFGIVGYDRNTFMPAGRMIFSYSSGDSAYISPPMTQEAIDIFNSDWDAAEVVWDGVTYFAKQQTIYGITCCGNVDKYMGTGDNGMPFVILAAPAELTGTEDVGVVFSVYDSPNILVNTSHHTFVKVEGQSYEISELTNVLNIIEGTEYCVEHIAESNNWRTFVAISYSTDDGTYTGIGNPAMLGLGDDNGGQLFIYTKTALDGTQTSAVLRTSVDISVRVYTPRNIFRDMSITLLHEQINPIDSKFISEVSWNNVTDKPFYREPSRVILDTIFQDTKEDNNGDGVPETWERIGFLEDSSDITLIAGNTYTITWNDVKYTSECTLYMGLLPVIGNLDAMLGTGDNGAPFVLVRDIDGLFLGGSSGWLAFIISNYTDDGKYTCKIETLSLKYLDNKYLEFMDCQETEILPEVTVDFIASGSTYLCSIYDTPIAVTNGTEYIFVWDGTEYTYKAYFTDGLYAFGNIETVTPFAVVVAPSGNAIQIATSDASPSHTFAIRTPAKYTIKEEYLPDNIGGGSGPTLPEVTTEDAGKFLRVTDEGIWAAVSIPNAEGVGF